MLELIASGAEQFLTDDPERLIVLTHSIGASCIEGCAIFTEILTDQSMPHIRLAARLIGAYGEFLDHNLDIDEDLAQGSNTYATARIRTDGDSPALRREIKARYYDEASDAYAAGKEVLNRKQQRRYKALRTLIDTKFKFADAVKSRLSR
jgi:hypothetical protein